MLSLGVIAVSTSAILVRLAFQAASTRSIGFVLVLAASRLGLAALAMLILNALTSNSATAQGKDHYPSEQRSPEKLHPNLPIQTPRWSTLHIFSIGCAAGICLAIHFAAWISSLAYTSVAASTALVTTNPVWVVLIAWLWLGERPQRSTAIGVGIAVLGGLLIAQSSDGNVGSNPLLGNSLALVGAWTVSIYLLIAQSIQRAGVGLKTYLTIVYSTAALILLPLPLVLGADYTGYPPQVYLWIALMAMIPQIIGHAILNWAVRWLSPTQVTLAILFEPICAGLLAYVIFGELPTIWVLVGGALLLVGIVFVTREQSS